MNWINITEAFHLKDGIPFFGGVATVFFLYSCQITILGPPAVVNKVKELEDGSKYIYNII